MKINSVTDLQTFLHGMFHGRPGDHHPRIQHAANVNEHVVMAIVGALAAVADAGSIEVRERNGRVANMTWFSVGGREYVLAYNRDTGGVDIRPRRQQGRIVATLNDKNIDRIWPVFAAL